MWLVLSYPNYIGWLASPNHLSFFFTLSPHTNTAPKHLHWLINYGHVARDFEKRRIMGVQSEIRKINTDKKKKLNKALRGKIWQAETEIHSKDNQIGSPFWATRHRMSPSKPKPSLSWPTRPGPPVREKNPRPTDPFLEEGANRVETKPPVASVASKPEIPFPFFAPTTASTSHTQRRRRRPRISRSRLRNPSSRP